MKHLTLQQVVEHDYCVGCGLCVSQSNKGKMLTTAFGTYIPDLDTLSNEEQIKAEQYCPSAQVSDAEDRLAKSVFFKDNLEHLDGLGFYHKTYAGFAIEGDFRNQGSSAGLVNWLCSKLLSLKLIDSVVHVKEDTSNDKTMYSYQESKSLEDLQTGAKSKYYPIELSEVVRKLQNEPDKKVAVVGLPCFIKALRALEEHNIELRSQIKFHIGIVCGHLKSKNYAEFLGWQAGISPEKLRLLDFRTKIDGRPASRYGFTAVPKDGTDDTWVMKPMSDVVGGNWGHGVFKLNACEYCDDVMAEAADIVFGDAWLPEFVSDSNGTNVINSRSIFLTKLLEEEALKGNIELIDLSPERMLDSQRSGLRHRREGLSYRSEIARKNGKPIPIKRTKPGSEKLSLVREQTYEQRELIRMASHNAFLLSKRHNNLQLSLSILKPIIENYTKLTQAPLHRRIAGRVAVIINTLLKPKS